MVLALQSFLILAEFGHSDRNGGILRKKRKNSAKIGMVGSYGTDVGRCSRRSRGQRWLEETHFPMCCPAREGLRSKVSAIQPTFIMLTNFSPCFLNYWCGPQVHNYFLVWSEGQNGWTALL